MRMRVAQPLIDTGGGASRSSRPLIPTRARERANLVQRRIYDRPYVRASEIISNFLHMCYLRMRKDNAMLL